MDLRIASHARLNLFPFQRQRTYVDLRPVALTPTASGSSFRYYEEFKEELKSATGIDPAALKETLHSRYKFAKGFIAITTDRARDQSQLLLSEARALKDRAEKEFELLRARYLPQFVAYNSWELWKVSVRTKWSSVSTSGLAVHLPCLLKFDLQLICRSCVAGCKALGC